MAFLVVLVIAVIAYFSWRRRRVSANTGPQGSPHKHKWWSWGTFFLFYLIALPVEIPLGLLGNTAMKLGWLAWLCLFNVLWTRARYGSRYLRASWGSSTVPPSQPDPGSLYDQWNRGKDIVDAVNNGDTQNQSGGGSAAEPTQ